MPSEELRHGRAPGDGVQLHYVEAGAGPAVVLLHGFPDFWFGWRHQLMPLVHAGYRVIAPDLRGYNESDRPRGVRHYRLERLTADIAAFVRHVAPDCEALVGHDWGGVLAWTVAAQQPELCSRLVILNAPHPDIYLRVLRRHPAQALRSWYVFVNQLPGASELALRAFDFAALRRVLGRTEDGAPMATPTELARYVDVFSQPGALTAALNYYRAAGRSTLRRRRRSTGVVNVPTLILWGDRDPYLDDRLLSGMERHVPRLRLQRLPHAGHFLHWQDAGTVNALLRAFLRE